MRLICWEIQLYQKGGWGSSLQSRKHLADAKKLFQYQFPFDKSQEQATSSQG